MQSDDDDDWSEDDDVLSDASSPPDSQRSTVPPTLTLAHTLPEPTPATYTIKRLYEMLIQAKIDLSPDYQRDVVWPDAKQSMLIDSLMRNYYIPPIILAKCAGSDGKVSWTCIDGKQRLSSIWKFMQGQILYRDKPTKTAWYYTNLGKNSRIKLLPDVIRRTFDEKKIVCIIYNDISQEDEREVFQRVQMGMALKKDEKWNALMGKHPDLVRKVLRTYVDGDNGLGSLLPWDTDRSKDFSCAAEAITRLSILPGTKGKTVEAWLHTEVDSVDPEFEQLVNDAFRLFVILASNAPHSKVFKTHPKVAPIEFIMTVVLIGMYMDKLTLPGLAAAIAGMRKDVRATHKDIKNNERVRKTMFTFLNKKVATPDIPRAETAAGTLPKLKRKRSESPDAPLAQLLHKKLKQSSSAPASSLFSVPAASASAKPVPTRPQPAAPSTPMLVPKLKSASSTQSPAEFAMPAPPTPALDSSPANTITPLSSAFLPEEDVKPQVFATLSWKPLPLPALQSQKSSEALKAELARARSSFQVPPGGLLGQRKPLFS